MILLHLLRFDTLATPSTPETLEAHLYACTQCRTSVYGMCSKGIDIITYRNYDKEYIRNLFK